MRLALHGVRWRAGVLLGGWGKSERQAGALPQLPAGGKRFAAGHKPTGASPLPGPLTLQAGGTWGSPHPPGRGS